MQKFVTYATAERKAGANVRKNFKNARENGKSFPFPFVFFAEFYRIFFTDPFLRTLAAARGGWIIQLLLRLV